jgi:hypothetical protein
MMRSGRLSARRRATWLMWLAVACSLAGASARLAAVSAESLVRVSPNDPFGGCTSDDVSQQFGTNYPGSQVEPWLAVNPANRNNLAGSWQQDRWSNGGSRGLVTGVSVDGGVTWTPIVMPGITLCSGGNFQRASDPWLSFGPTGDLYHISLAFDMDPSFGVFGRNALLVSKSGDGGYTWTDPLTLIETEIGVLNDKESITADPTDASRVYAVWDRSSSIVEGEGLMAKVGRGAVQNQRWSGSTQADSGRSPVYFTRSTDGGQTWEPAREIFDPGRNSDTIGNVIVVLPDGMLIDLFTLIRTVPDRVPRAKISFVYSTDRGMSWRPRPRAAIRILSRAFVTPFAINDVYDPESQQPLRTGDVLPSIAVDANSGNLYVVWQDARFSNGGDFSDANLLIDEIAFSMSSNGGRRWSRPIKVNRTPTNVPLENRQAFTPAVHVAADGTIAVTYYDFRFNDGASDLKTDYFMVRCQPSSTRRCSDSADWTDEVRVTPASFDFTHAPVAGGFFTGDYQGLAADGNMFLTLFSQVAGGGPAAVFFGRLP